MKKTYLNWAFRWFTKLFDYFGLSVYRAPPKESKVLCYEIQAMTYNLVKEHLALADRTSVIIFSKDRPAQLDLLLRSIKKYLNGPDAIIVLYRASDDQIKRAYDEVFSAFGHYEGLTIKQESGFRQDLLQLLNRLNSRFVMFLVDDCVFRRPLDLCEITERYWPWSTVFSPRLGKNTIRCYTRNTPQKLPNFLSQQEGKLWWRWSDGDQDFAYPLSLDGNLFSTAEFRALLNLISFKAPNSLEKNLQVFSPLFVNRLGLTFDESLLVNIPDNRVQNEVLNRANSIDGAIKCIENWNNGNMIDLGNIVSTIPSGAHDPIKYRWIKRSK